MAKSAFPILIGVGAIALLASGSKKKSKPKSDDSYTPPDETYYEPTPTVKPKPTPGGKPAGNPPRGETYDGPYWDSTPGGPRLESIRNHFKELGYNVNIGPWPMNKMGPKKGSPTMEYTNEDGTTGWSGGNDDVPSAIVKRFQGDYNTVSRLNKAENIYSQKMGGLNTDGLVGGYTLNGLRYAVEGLPGGKTWSDLIQQAKLKGIT